MTYESLKVGDEVVLHRRSHGSSLTTRVAKVGRLLLSVPDQNGHVVQLQRSDGRSRDDYWSISTLAEEEASVRLREASKALAARGVRVNQFDVLTGGRLPEFTVEMMEQVVALVDEAWGAGWQDR